MKKIITVVLMAAFVFTSCEDEPIQTMNDINNEWQESAKDIGSAKKVIEDMMSKYEAVSFTFKKNEDTDDKYTIYLLDDKKKTIELSSTDQQMLNSAFEVKLKAENGMKMTADVDNVFTIVEEQPQPEAGMQSYYQFIAENMSYPTSAKENGIEGKVFVQFIVTEFGEVTDVKVVKGIGHGCDEEAARVVKASPAWTPGKQDGKAVNVRMVLPITFKLG